MKKRFTLRAIAAIAVLLCLLSANLGGYVAFAAAPATEWIKDAALDEINRPIEFPLEKPVLPVLPGGLKPADKPLRPEEPAEPLPEAYCMRDEYLVFAQHQDKHGYCWNFAATMAASTTIMKATGEYYDFSELWTGITCYTPTKNYFKVGAGGSFSYQY
ncbi:MAG: hypothetical protein J6V07_03230 [Clostridia bacterium]|nr:hypothetical protein [Clostridia bacterium]